MTTMLDIRDRLIAGTYRSDRFTAVPFKTLEDVMQEAQDALTPRENPYPSCGASLTQGNITRYCAERIGHVSISGTEHDWARYL